MTWKWRSTFWKPKGPTHIRGWGAGCRHGPPFSKRPSGKHRRQARLFTIRAKRSAPIL